MLLYDINMCTPLGWRSGELRAKMQDGRLKGEMSLLGKAQPIDGTVLTDGTWQLRGRLVTLVNIIDYHATGKMNGDTLQLSLEGNGKTFPIIGKLREVAE